MSLTGQSHFLLLEVIPPHYHHELAIHNMVELEQLVATFGGVVVDKAIQHRVHPHPDTYIGRGKLAWLMETIQTEPVDVVVINDIVKPSQLFRIEKQLWTVNPQVMVWDKVDLILNIFNRHAHTQAAKLQIELARLDHLGPRIYGLGGTVLSRQGGGAGQRGGFGETNIERERRLMKLKRLHIKKQLAVLARQKQDRLRYRQELGFGPVALVGYTSAGKTTLFNSLTGKTKDTQAGLFTTLDTVVGRLKIASSPMPILLSDTIGFIADLPPSLIDAFRSTLMESLNAKLLLHVIDAADPHYPEKIAIVEVILKDLHLTQPVVRVFNKIDHLTNDDLSQLRTVYPDQSAQFISAKSGLGLPALKSLMARRLVKS